MAENLPKKVLDWTLNHFWITFITLFIINLTLLILGGRIHFIFVIVPFFLLLIYIILYLIYRIRVNITKLLHHELHFGELLRGYITSVIFIILLFSILYWSMPLIGTGYLKYGSCTAESVSRSLIQSDPTAVKEEFEYPYFSSITFFTVGYGDICPMGWDKLISMLNAWMGNSFTVLILAIAITNYSANKNDEKNGKENKDDKENSITLKQTK